MSKLISEISEADFLSLIIKIYTNEYATEDEHIDAVLEFEALTEHPSGSDLLFYPEEGKIGPEAILKEVKEWRAANGKPGFKTA
ncbi:bacteriocin immunity protein [Pseudomonas batumici]|uniref:bacteriocin immunity protein n=1 Tax=Pseudomonas batumici TaxID=226910 RepID=UPI00058A18F1|nr:bacteriocin immunity protein [Pseudomonas batumici]